MPWPEDFTVLCRRRRAGPLTTAGERIVAFARTGKPQPLTVRRVEAYHAMTVVASTALTLTASLLNLTED